MQEDYTDSANAYVPAPFVTALPADGTVSLNMQGNDWAGMTLTITEIDPADVPLTISVSPSHVTTVSPYVNDTQMQGVASSISIEAQAYIDCDNNGEVLVFDHWEVISGEVLIVNPAAAVTTARFTDIGGGEIQAVYVDGAQCGDICHQIIPQDLYGDDCVVDLQDFSVFAGYWLSDTTVQ